MEDVKLIGCLLLSLVLLVQYLYYIYSKGE